MENKYTSSSEGVKETKQVHKSNLKEKKKSFGHFLSSD